MVMDIGDPRLVTHNGGDKINAIEEFKNSDKPLVMVSPSSERGISLDGDKCRWVVWMKCPYLSLADKLVSARIYKSAVGGLWYRSNALMSVVQGCGRAVRSKDDTATVYILDQQIVKLITENPTLVPKWFRDACW
jgi:Rad3-related DNA helicase